MHLARAARSMRTRFAQVWDDAYSSPSSKGVGPVLLFQVRTRPETHSLRDCEVWDGVVMHLNVRIPIEMMEEMEMMKIMKMTKMKM